MCPVRIGNLAYRQVQHDVYGAAILAATHVFFHERLTRRGDEALFHRLEALGEQARRCYDQPDAGLWELRGSARVHTFVVDVLGLAEVGFLDAADPRFAATVSAVEKDDFGEPEKAFPVCPFWYVNALAALDRRDEARALFAKLLACRNHHGLLAEHIDPHSGEQWGNFVQTYSMVGLINAAIRLSVRWDQAFLIMVRFRFPFGIVYRPD